MELLDRYLRTVKLALPLTKQQDVVRELSANIQETMEERVAELKRPLNEAEQEEILRRHGTRFWSRAAPPAAIMAGWLSDGI